MSLLRRIWLKVPEAMVILIVLGSGAVKPEDLPETPAELYRRVRELYSLGKYAQAIPIAEKLLKTVERDQGPNHRDTATSLNSLAVLYMAVGLHAKAEPLYLRALAIFETALGPNHPDTATSVNNLAELYRMTGAYAKAEPLFQRALAITEKVQGPEHSNTAMSLSNLAVLYQGMGDYAKAEPLLQRALSIYEKVLGPDHPDTANTLNNLAFLYETMGQYAKAEPLFQRALAIREKAQGPNHPLTANGLNNLASLYHDMGAHDKAEPLYQRALAIFETALGPSHPDTARSLNNLAELYRAVGAYAKAEPLHMRVVAIFEKALGPDHPNTATALGNLAALYDDMGAYAKAEPLYQRALAITEKALGPDHPDTANKLNNLASLYRGRGVYAIFQPPYQRSVSITEYAKAEPLYQRALSINENALGPEHPNTATSLDNLALLYELIGTDGKAEPLYKRALAIREKALGPSHPDIADSLSNLAWLSWAEGRWSEAIGRFRRCAQIQESNAQNILALGDESRKRAYLQKFTSSTNATVSFSLASHGKIEHSDALGLELVLQRKGRVLEVLAETYGATRRSLLGQDRQLFDRWREVNGQYATVVFRGPRAMPAKDYRELVDKLKRETETLEAQLSQRSAEFRAQTETVTVERVQQAIPADAALIEWFRFSPFNPKAEGQERPIGPPRYVAYVLKREGQPVAMDLGQAAGIERNLSDLLAALHDPKSQLAGELGRELDRQLLQPLRPHLGDVSRLYLSPDGLLNLLPFGALVDEQQYFLAKRWPITYLTSGRDLLRLAQTSPQARTPIVVADPDFGRQDKTTLATAAESRRSNDMADGAMRFNPLPGTAAEAKALQGLLKLKGSQVLTGNGATETALKQVHGPHILHIATHGFFLPDQPRRIESPLGSSLGQERVTPPQGENPLLRSGLALAGANALHSGQDDGVLTALEVAGLDLTGTQLAVLSACETGIGTVQNGEGVYGLRRALVLAGVRTQVTSLWKVDDAATKDLMVDYYRRLQAGVGKSQALREAQLAMLKNPARAHPYYWASFIAIGEDKPIGP